MKQLHKAVQALESDIGFWWPSWIFWKSWKTLKKLDESVYMYHVNTQEGSPSYFSNKSYTLIIIFADNQFVHVIIK